MRCQYNAHRRRGTVSTPHTNASLFQCTFLSCCITFLQPLNFVWRNGFENFALSETSCCRWRNNSRFIRCRHLRLATQCRMHDNHWTGKDLEGSGRGLTRCSIWRGWMINLIQDMQCHDRELNPARHTLPMEPISTVFDVSAYRRPDWFIPDNCSQFV